MPGSSGSRDPRYDSTEWRALRKLIRRRDLRCKGPCDGYHSSRYVDHIVPEKDGGDFWDTANLQGLCDACHKLKSRTEQGQRGELGGGVTQRTALVKGCDASGVPLDPRHWWNDRKTPGVTG